MIRGMAPQRSEKLREWIFFQFIFSIISSTVPVPSGIFIPVFKIGAALGRAVGEAMALWFPTGVRYGGIITPIIPGKSNYRTLHRGSTLWRITIAKYQAGEAKK